MTATLTGPDTCAQCGREFDRLAILAEAIATGTSDAVTEAYATIRGHRIAIPGLYWDRECGAQIESGELESNLSLGACLAFLDNTWGPQVTSAGVKAMASGNDGLADMAARRVADIIEVSLILEIVIEALNEGSDLSWLPECHGHGDEAGQADPRSVAHLN